MKKFFAMGMGALALVLSSVPAQAQSHDRKPGDMPGPIDSVDDLQDTGRMLFKLADENNDNQISQKEAVDAGNLLVGGFFFRADANGDGVLSPEEARQARDAFLNTKPWLRYAVETARNSRGGQGAAGAGNTANQNLLASLSTVWDTNNDKQLQAAELRQTVQTAVTGAFSSADTNRDGQLTQIELNAAMAGAARQAAQLAFQQADTDHNGAISQAEFEKAIVEPSRVAFRVMDLNHDGQLSPQEAQTARQLVMSKVRTLTPTEAPNSPRNAVQSAIGSQTAPAAGAPAASTAPQPPAAPR